MELNTTELVSQARDEITKTAAQYGYSLEMPPQFNTIYRADNGDVRVYFTVRFRGGPAGQVKVILRHSEYRIVDITPVSGAGVPTS